MKYVLTALATSWAVLCFGFLFIIFNSSNPANAANQPQEMIYDINAARATNNLPSVVDNPALDISAHNKACDMRDKNYFEHNRPSDGKTPWSFMREAGYNYKDAGENIYEGNTDMKEAMNLFLASPEHRKNILNPVYVDVGIGVCGPYIVQHFADK